MSDDEKMLHIGYWSIGVVFFLTVVLSAMSRTQNREINHVRRSIVKTQQEIALAEAQFASYVRPESLRNMVVTIQPKSEVVSFNKSVAIENLENREEK
ncbi:MAG: hypothetical protein J6J82_03285 [Alphaproteobacteria bacterium]|nr:hypothetical protein [Alphaproteobacteria bacterium]